MSILITLSVYVLENYGLRVDVIEIVYFTEVPPTIKNIVKSSLALKANPILRKDRLSFSAI